MLKIVRNFLSGIAPGVFITVAVLTLVMLVSLLGLMFKNETHGRPGALASGAALQLMHKAVGIAKQPMHNITPQQIQQGLNYIEAAQLLARGDNKLLRDTTGVDVDTVASILQKYKQHFGHETQADWTALGE